MTWKVKNFNFNKQIIEDYDVLAHKEDFIKKLKKKCANKKEFAEKLKKEMMYHYWSRAEYELVIEVNEDNRIVLVPWVGCRDEEKAAIDVTDDVSFDWRGFAEHHISNQVYKNKAKIDIWDQLSFENRFEQMVTLLWTTRLRYERDAEKFHQ